MSTHQSMRPVQDNIRAQVAHAILSRLASTDAKITTRGETTFIGVDHLPRRARIVSMANGVGVEVELFDYDQATIFPMDRVAVPNTHLVARAAVRAADWIEEK